MLPSSYRVWYGLGQVYQARFAKQACQEVEAVPAIRLYLGRRRRFIS